VGEHGEDGIGHGAWGTGKMAWSIGHGEDGIGHRAWGMGKKRGCLKVWEYGSLGEGREEWVKMRCSGVAIRACGSM